MTDTEHGAPRLARLLLATLLPPEARETLAGDLEEEYVTTVRPRAGAFRARLWFWRQTIGTIAWCALRRDRQAGPAVDGSYRGDGIVQNLLQDLRFGIRMLARKPGFTLVAVVTLALGIGANTAIFSVVHEVILRPLPYPDADRIVTVWEHNARDGIEHDDVSPANFLDWQERQQVFEALGTSNPWSLDLGEGTEPETVQSALVSPDFLEILGARPLHGRLFLPEEFEPGHGAVVVLTYGLWQRKFGGDVSIVGRTLRLDGEPTTIVGVLGPEFKPQLHVPERTAYQPQVVDEDWARQRRATYLKVVGRLEPDVTPDEAQAALQTIATQLGEEYPTTNAEIGVRVVPLAEHLIGRVRPALLVLLGAVTLVLLIACANVANLMLARGAEREREIAIRSALGAGRGRIVLLLIADGLLLSILGCAAGLLLAGQGLAWIRAVAPAGIPRIEKIGLDPWVLAFCAGLALVCTVLAGLAPALRLARTDLQDPLRRGSAGSAGSGRNALRAGLVVAEVSLALVLLIGAGLFVRSFVNLLQVDPGFARSRVVALQTFIWDRQTTVPARQAFARQAVERMAGLPGVEAAAVTTAVPFLDSSRDSSYPILVEGQAALPEGQEPTGFFTVISGDYFRVMGIPLLSGRIFDERDAGDGAPATIINEALARRIGLDDDPVGRRVQVRFRTEWVGFEIVGLVGSTRHESLDSAPRAEMYMPISRSNTGSLIFLARTANDPAPLVPQLKDVVWDLDPTQPFYAVETIDGLVDRSLSERRFQLGLLGAFAALALVLATIGIYGVISVSTAQRTREIGIRLALGARRPQIVGLVLRTGMWLAGAGVLIGLGGASALTGLVRQQLFGIEPLDPVTYGAISGLILAVGAMACWLPALRATRVDPQKTLRDE